VDTRRFEMTIKMTVLRLLLLVALALITLNLSSGLTGGSGPWVPFVAQRIASLYRVSGSGKTLIQQVSEVWMRNSQGSTYLRKTPIVSELPEVVYEKAMLSDATTGTTYMLDYAAKTVRILGKGKAVVPPTSAAFSSNMPQDRFLQKKTIAGVECLQWQMLSANSVDGAASEPGGEMCFAPSLNFAPIESVTSDGAMESDVEVTSIQPGQEPDPKFFQLPDGFPMVN
jgi:hypothetical protein